MEKHYTDYKGRPFPGTFTVPDYDEDGYPVTVPTSKPQPVVPDSDHVPGELIIHDPDEYAFRYPL